LLDVAQILATSADQGPDERLVDGQHLKNKVIAGEVCLAVEHGNDGARSVDRGLQVPPEDDQKAALVVHLSDLLNRPTHRKSKRHGVGIWLLLWVDEIARQPDEENPATCLRLSRIGVELDCAVDAMLHGNGHTW